MVDQAVAAVGVDQPELAASAEARDRRPGQPLAKTGGKGVPQIATPKLDSLDPLAEEYLGKPSNGGFDFGKFGHQRDMAKLAAAS
jgi:hypothetical protein